MPLYMLYCFANVYASIVSGLGFMVEGFMVEAGRAVNLTKCQIL